MLGEFDARLFVFNAFLETEPVSKLSPAEINAGLQRITLTDWLEGLASIGFAPLFMRPLRARNFLDLALGRVRLRFFFHAPNFVDLCRRSGVQAGFLTRKETNRIRSQQKWRDGDYPLYKGQAITYQIGNSQGIFGSLRLHEILFNWVRPLSIVKLLADANAKPEAPTSDSLGQPSDVTPP